MSPIDQVSKGEYSTPWYPRENVETITGYAMVCMNSMLDGSLFSLHNSHSDYDTDDGDPGSNSDNSVWCCEN